MAQRNFDGVQIEPVKVSDHIYVLFGSGGNIALVTGENQNYIIDDQFAPLSDKLEFAIKNINPKPIAYVLNTHWHGDPLSLTKQMFFRLNFIRIFKETIF